MRREVPPGTMCFTDRLAGSSLDALLEKAETNWWPSASLEREWELLRTWAFQTECLMIDEAENLEWEAQMRALLQQNLPYLEFVAARMEALDARLSSRKLAQTNLRYRYGFKPKKASLVRRDVIRFYRLWSSE